MKYNPIYFFYICWTIFFYDVPQLSGQTCPNMATFCEDVPLVCGANNLNNSSCTLVLPANYNGDRCNELCTGSAQNQVHYAFVTNGSKIDIIVTTSGCVNDFYGAAYTGLDLGVSTACCGGISVACKRSPNPIPPNYQLKITIPAPVPCKIYYLDIDGLDGTVCDYTINISGGNAPLPLVLKNINNDPNNIIDISLGTCAYKFTVEPKDEPCEGYFEWTFDGAPLNDYDREVKLDFPDEGDFVLCVQGYIGLPDFNCGQSNMTCTTIKVKKDQFYGNPRILCNELTGFKWYQQKIISSGMYKQEFKEKCHIFDSIVEFIILPKPKSGSLNYFSCSNSDPYFDPVSKSYYRFCTSNKKIFIPKSTDIYACDSSYILHVAYVDLKNTFHLRCRNGNIYMTSDIKNYTDTCGIGLNMTLNYSWYEKINNKLVFMGQGKELKIIKKGNYQLQVLTQYQLGVEGGSCTTSFDEDIDEDTYLISPNTGSLLGKIQVCKADIECYTVEDLVKNPFSFTWIVDQGMIITSNPDTSKKICVQWDKNSTLTHGKICVTYSDSCSSNLQACLDIEFGKSQKDVAGPDQELGGVLGTKMNALGTKGLWTYSGGPGTAHFEDPTNPKSKVRVSRFGNYTFKWTTMQGDCEVFGYVSINFYIEFPQLEGEYYKPFYIIEKNEEPFSNVKINYLNNQLSFTGDKKSDTNFHYTIFNTHGQIIHLGKFQNSVNHFSKDLDIILDPGIYFILFESDSGISAHKFLVMD